MNATAESKLVKHQVKEFWATFTEENRTRVCHLEVRWDDSCGNGHNSFAMTGAVYHTPDIEIAKAHKNNDRMIGRCGCVHDAIAAAFPQFKHLLKWHLCSSDEPMHYTANAKFWAGFSPTWPPADDPNQQKFYPANYDHLRSTIVYGALPEDLNEDVETMNWIFLKAFLIDRLPKLIYQMRAEIEEFGFVW